MTWKKVVFLLLLVAAGIWAYFHFFAAAGDTGTEELPQAYAQGNPVALSELKKRPYDKTLSPPFRKMAVESMDPKVREAAVWYLAAGSEPAEEGVIISALGDPDPRVREAACNAAKLRKMKKAVDVIIPLVEDDDIDVKGAARSALQSITGIHRYMGRSEWEQQWNMMNENR
ncbi:MAG: HEAT repeat domain-containing protein [Planctomycetes bacterium]|nr:HEAT repeat domain-containing protein [Planctomycetota bacterium]